MKQRNYPKHILPSAMVKEFMETFGQPVKSNPEFPSRNIAWMRLKLILEETWELMVAMYRRDMVGIADALGDLVYVVVGMAHTYGIPFDAVIREIHRSNMAKAGPDGKAILRADGKIQKPEGWTPPDLRKVMGL
jgi:predicted HAD superfamily Cof-like phosphohydrolase